MTFVKTIKCDYKGCKKKADIPVSQNLQGGTLPEKWRGASVVSDPGRYGESNHYCPDHAELLGMRVEDGK